MSKAALVKCPTYDSDVVYKAIKAGIDMIGGIHVPEKAKILVKPNILLGVKPEKHATTHPSVLEAVLRYLREHITIDESVNSVKIHYGDSPGFGDPQKAAAAAGLKKSADKYHIPFADFKNGREINISGEVIDKVKVADGVLESDYIINLPKMKSHQLTGITGAVKNMFGAVVGLSKVAVHAKFPEAIVFSKAVCEICKAVRPALTVMDGIIAMEGNGPQSGDPVQMNVLIVSDDPVLADAVFCKLVNISPDFIPTVWYGETIGLGSADLKTADLYGENPESLVNKSFHINRRPIKSETFLPVFNFMKNFFLRKPVIDRRKCVKCGICVDACPLTGQALIFKNKNQPPVYHYNSCIRCYCCQEMCPKEAISVKTPLLGKIFFYRGDIKKS